MSKPDSLNYDERFRNIIFDPINVLINKAPTAGFTDGNFVYLHNGIKVPVSGEFSYYDTFSKILILNRGIHEPLEEFVFQQLLTILPDNPTMLELGAYWGHYSMWLKQKKLNSCVILVEPNKNNLNVGKANFERMKFDAEFILDKVCPTRFVVDHYLKEKNIKKLNILHSDIQGHEVEMLAGSVESLKNLTIDYVLISTHSQKLHYSVKEQLENFNYTIEISSDFDNETTSDDGFILATSSAAKLVMNDWKPLDRKKIVELSSVDTIDFLNYSKNKFNL